MNAQSLERKTFNARPCLTGTLARQPWLGREGGIWARIQQGLLILCLTHCLQAHAQWQTQNILIKPGWTAVYLHVDASYASLDQLVGADASNPISEIWLWQAAQPTLQFVTSPQNPTAGNSQWLTWGRIGLGFNNSLGNLIPNGAYLVHSVASEKYIWSVRGKPASPNYTWTSTGLNFIGFPTPSANQPNFDAFLALAPSFQSTAEIYQYPGGDLGAGNPGRLLAYHTTPVTRGQAFWMRSGTLYNSYFGPFQVVVQDSGGLNYLDTGSQLSFRLRNVTATNVTVTAKLLASEAPPAGQTPIAGGLPLLVRGAINTTNLTYSYTALNQGGTCTWTLRPQGQSGSDIVVVLGLNRYALSGNPGDIAAGILQFTDSFGLSEVNVSVAAQVSSTAGLWVGNASVNQVGSYLKIYQTDSNHNPILTTNGNYVITSTNTGLGGVAQPYPLRLIVHNDGNNVVLLQRVYYGLNLNSNLVVATSESALDPAKLSSARRISATHLAGAATNVWSFGGHLLPGGTLTTTAFEDYSDQAANPFLHTYHPDHDNLNATFKSQLPPGSESYNISRSITMTISPPGDDFTSLTSANQTLSGSYLETITLGGAGGASRSFNVSGGFALSRLSRISTLTR